MNKVAVSEVCCPSHQHQNSEVINLEMEIFHVHLVKDLHHKETLREGFLGLHFEVVRDSSVVLDYDVQETDFSENDFLTCSLIFSVVHHLACLYSHFYHEWGWNFGYDCDDGSLCPCLDIDPVHTYHAYVCVAQIPSLGHHGA